MSLASSSPKLLAWVRVGSACRLMTIFLELGLISGAKVHSLISLFSFSFSSSFFFYLLSSCLLSRASFLFKKSLKEDSRLPFCFFFSLDLSGATELEFCMALD